MLIRNIKRAVILSGLAIVVGACGGGGGGGGGTPPPPPPVLTGVALFANNTYVDYIPGDSNSEASNMEAALRSQGHTVTPFTGITAAEITAALAGKKVFVLPGLPGTSLDLALDAAARTAISDFVNAGGILISAYTQTRNLAVLNSSFGYALVPTPDSAPFTRDAAAAAGTAFANCGPTTLSALIGTNAVTAASLPAGAKAIYTDTAGNAVATIIPQGSGSVVLLGPDFFNFKPTGVQDGGWWHVLYRAARLNDTLPTVAVVSAVTASGNAADVVTQLESTCQFAAIDTIDVATSIPTLAQLQAYPSVIFVNGGSVVDSIALGDVLADYVDGGGGVVLSMFAYSTTSLGINAGRFVTANYFAIPGNTNQVQNTPETGDFTLGFSSHPALSGVASFDGGPGSYQPNTSNVVAGVGATRMANWSDTTTPLVVTRQIGTARRIDLGFWAASNNINATNWDVTTDGEYLMANALTWAANLPQPAVQTFSKVDGSVIATVPVNSNLVVSGAPTSISKVTVTLNITHTWDADLDIFLEAPDGTLIELTTDNGSSGNNYTNTVFDDAAATAIQGLGNTFPPFTGSFISEQPLAGLNGKDANGTWILRVTDDTIAFSNGVLNSWSISVR